MEVGFLSVRDDGSYARSRDAETSRTRSVKASLESQLKTQIASLTRLRRRATRSGKPANKEISSASSLSEGRLGNQTRQLLPCPRHRPRCARVQTNLPQAFRRKPGAFGLLK